MSLSLAAEMTHTTTNLMQNYLRIPIVDKKEKTSMVR
jgi:hypothetical protein